MRLSVFLLLCTMTVASAENTRKSAYDELRNEALASSLVDQIAEDISARHYEAALKKADEALVLKPNDIFVLNARGAALTELGRYDEARKDLESALAIDPEAFAPQFNLAEVLSLQKKYVDAAIEFANLQGRYGATSLLKYKTYINYALGGRQDAAKEALSLLRYPADGPAWYYAHAAEKLLAGKPAEAKRLIAAARAIHGDKVGAYADTLRDTGLLK